MANTTFFREVKTTNSLSIWKGIFSESFKKHTREERAYAMSIGTPLTTPTEAEMLQTWRKPWLWFPAALIGFGIILSVYVLTFGLLGMGLPLASALITMNILVPPFVIPVVVMIFLWELNVPQNISVMDLLGYFLVSTVMCFAFLTPMFMILDDVPKYIGGPGREEPVKFVVAWILLWFAENKQGKKIYSMTGLVIGAAVGAAFAAVETFDYGMDATLEGGLLEGFEMVFGRVSVAVGGHMVYTAPYAAMFAMAKRKTGSWVKALMDPWFLLSFASSVLLHGLWNMFWSYGLVIEFAMIALEWALLFFWVHKCMMDILDIGQRGMAVGGSAASVSVRLTCVQGALKGKSWTSSGGELVLGRGAGCAVQLPENAQGVSRQHCAISWDGKTWVVRDLNATYGTYLTSGKLNGGASAVLSQGDMIYLGSKQEAYQVTFGA